LRSVLSQLIAQAAQLLPPLASSSYVKPLFFPSPSPGTDGDGDGDLSAKICASRIDTSA